MNNLLNCIIKYKQAFNTKKHVFNADKKVKYIKETHYHKKNCQEDCVRLCKILRFVVHVFNVYTCLPQNHIKHKKFTLNGIFFSIFISLLLLSHLKSPIENILKLLNVFKCLFKILRVNECVYKWFYHFLSMATFLFWT